MLRFCGSAGLLLFHVSVFYGTQEVFNISAASSAQASHILPMFGQPWQCSPARHESSRIPLVADKQRNKDTATPATGDQTMVSRLKKRKQRHRRLVIVRITKPMQMMRNNTMPVGASAKERFIWRRVHTPREKPADLADVICGLCWETNNHYCACGSGIAAHHVAAELSGFAEFCASDRNPILRLWDPEDQRLLLDAIRANYAPGASLDSLFAVCCLAGLAGRPESVRALGAVAASGSREALEQQVQAMCVAGKPVFRGGQRPGLSTERIAGAVHELCALAVEVPAALAKLKATRTQKGKVVFPDASNRRDGLYAVCTALKRIADSKLVKGVSVYKTKKIFGMLQLACYCGVGDLYMQPSDLRALHAVYPLPNNSANALQRIFPTATDKLSRRHGMRLLEKVFNRADIGCLVAQLCLWTEQMGGKIQYLG